MWTELKAKWCLAKRSQGSRTGAEGREGVKEAEQRSLTGRHSGRIALEHPGAVAHLLAWHRDVRGCLTEHMNEKSGRALL